MTMWPCVSCGEDYDTNIFPLCPVCFKLACRKCSHKQIWYVVPGRNNQICEYCGEEGMDPERVPRALIE